jgi:hypothetical protein
MAGGIHFLSGVFMNKAALVFALFLSFSAGAGTVTEICGKPSIKIESSHYEFKFHSSVPSERKNSIRAAIQIEGKRFAAENSDELLIAKAAIDEGKELCFREDVDYFETSRDLYIKP